MLGRSSGGETAQQGAPEAGGLGWLLWGLKGSQGPLHHPTAPHKVLGPGALAQYASGAHGPHTDPVCM